MHSPSLLGNRDSVWRYQLLWVLQPYGNVVAIQRTIHERELKETASGILCQYRCHSISMSKSMVIENILATFGHKGERALSLVAPVSSDVRVSKMVITHGFNLDDIYQVAQSACADNFRDFLMIWGIPHD